MATQRSPENCGDGMGQKAANGPARWLACVGILFSVASVDDVLADWPTYRADQARSGFSRCDVSAHNWQPAWFATSSVRPQPAWPAPARSSLWQNLESISPRQREDFADVPLIVTDRLGKTHLVHGSSGGDFVRSLNVEDGSTNWLIPLRAPVRFAPLIHDDIVYFGCDDGYVRAADLQTGNLRWESRIGPQLPWIVGNGRVISPHPVRTSLLLFEDKIIAHAGLFPSQGVYSVALRKQTGELIWRRKTDTSPQGYLLADGEGRGIVPTGRAQPYLIELSNGDISATLPSPGGSFCMLTAERVYTGPGNLNEVGVTESGAESRMVTFPSQAIAAGNDVIWTANGTQLVCYREAELRAGKGDPIWSIPCELSANLIVVGNDASDSMLFVAGGHEIKIFNASTGESVQTLAVEDLGEQLIHLACSASDSTSILAATSTSGSTYVWHGTRTSEGSSELISDKTFIWNKEPVTSEDSQSENIKTPKQAGQPQPSRTRLTELRNELPCPVGLGLLLHVDELDAVQSFLEETEYQLVVIAKDQSQQSSWREHFLQSGHYGQRICIWPSDYLVNDSFERGIFNFVAVGGEFTSPTSPNTFCAEDGLLVFLEDVSASQGPSTSTGSPDRIIKIPQEDGRGAWRHQYASPTNDADAKDSTFAGAAGFRLHWFGGVGPRRIPDRHLRGAAPLVAGSSMVVHGDGCLIGVDPANGLERWQLQLPDGAMRYVIPYDSGYSCLTDDGSDLYVAAKSEIWRIDPKSGVITDRIAVPAGDQEHSWGYLSEVHGDLFATLMKTAAPRYSQDRVVLRQSFINDDYNSKRPLVCSDQMLRLKSDGSILWRRESSGVIPNSAISIDESAGYVVLVEGNSNEVRDSDAARVTTSQILKQGNLVCLDGNSGEQLWETPLQWPDAENMLYSMIADNRVVLVSSKSENEKAIYYIKIFDLTDGRLMWERHHVHVREGLFHGEQVHHPVALRRPNGQTTLIVEPYIYDLNTGEVIVPAGMPDGWVISRPGHSCGTMTGSADCLFFRANNPTVFNFNAKSSQERFVKLAPSRPSCWINMVPASGKLFIPEGSASCVCQYSLQTSMAFTPVNQDQLDLHLLQDVFPVKTP